MWKKIVEFFNKLFGGEAAPVQDPVPTPPALEPVQPTEPEAPVANPYADLPVLNITKMVKRGMTGPDVVTVQGRLKEIKYFESTVDGDFGPLTERAVKNFQLDRGLTADGIVGAITAGHMRIQIVAAQPVDPVVPPSSLKKGTSAWYKYNFDNMTYDAGYEVAIANQAKKLWSNRSRYQSVESSTGVPWWFTAILHSMEASGNFAGVMHNGEKIIGTGRKTTLVPKNRGPFATWEASAVDALKTLKGFDKVTDWSVGNALRLAELYNGSGYLTGAGKGDNSPYIWSMSSVNDGYGKYVADGKWSSTAPANGQVGCAVLLREFQKTYGLKLS